MTCTHWHSPSVIDTLNILTFSKLWPCSYVGYAQPLNAALLLCSDEQQHDIILPGAPSQCSCAAIGPTASESHAPSKQGCTTCHRCHIGKTSSSRIVRPDSQPPAKPTEPDTLHDLYKAVSPSQPLPLHSHSRAPATSPTNITLQSRPQSPNRPHPNL